MELVNAPTVVIVWYDGKQGPVTTTHSETVHFRKRMGRVSPQIRSTKHVCILSFSQAMITVQMKRESLVSVTLKAPPGKLWFVALLQKLMISNASCPLAS